MKISLLLARRYFVSLRQRGTIGLLSLISMVGIAVATGALVIILSAFNGLEALIRDLYASVDPDVKVMPTQGKFFAGSDSLLKAVQQTEGVTAVAGVIEDNALLRHQDAQMVIKIKGVSPNFSAVSGLQRAIFMGQMRLEEAVVPGVVVGVGVQAGLGIGLNQVMSPFQIWYPRFKKSMSLDPTRAFTKRAMVARGVFQLEKEFDEKYVYMALETARQLTSKPGQLTALEVAALDGEDAALSSRLQAKLGPRFVVQDREQQHASLVKVLRIERAFVVIALVVIMAISSMNIITALSMLAVEKRVDLAVLKAMGTRPPQVRNAFLMVGVLISTVGAFAGLIVGLALCVAQQEFGFVGMGISTAIVSSYPIKIESADVLLAMVSVSAIGILAAWLPARGAANAALITQLRG